MTSNITEGGRRRETERTLEPASELAGKEDDKDALGQRRTPGTKDNNEWEHHRKRRTKEEAKFRAPSSSAVVEDP